MVKEEHQATCLWDPMPHRAHDPKREQGGIVHACPGGHYVRQSFLGSILLHTHYTHTHTHAALSLLFGTQRGSNMGKKSARPCSFLLGFSPPFLWCSSILSEQGWTGKGIKFWVESLITDLGELSFRLSFPAFLPSVSCSSLAFLHLGTPFALPHSRKEHDLKMAKKKALCYCYW